MIKQYNELVELFEDSTQKYAERPLFGTKVDRRWVWMTYGEFRTEVNHLRSGLARRGIREGDRVAIIANNRVEWAAAAYATYGLGATFVPMYEQQLPREWKFILADCGARAVFVANEEIRLGLERIRGELPALEHVIGMEQPASDADSYRALVELGRFTPTAARHPAPDSVAALIYTSGTTGQPKGVLLTHHNISSNVSAILDLFDFGAGDRTLSFLPWAHAYGQTCELHGVLSMGCEIAINDDLSKLVDNLAEVKPTILVAVPRIFNKLFASIMKEIDARPRLIRTLIQAGIRAAVRRARGEHLGPLEGLSLTVDEKLVFSKIREKLGGRLRYAISAAASLNVEVAELIDALGIAVYEGYGLTEAGPIVAVNYPGHRKLGSVGRVISGVRVELRDVNEEGRGEIVVFGPNVMRGYHERPEENALAFTSDGGLRTGDLGYVDADGYLFITGRIKEQYKLENGKYGMPAPLEETFKLSPYIANVMLYGANRPYNVALVVPDRAALVTWAKKEGVELGDLATNSKVNALIMRELHLHSREMKPYEEPKACAITADDFTVDNGMLTPTQKLKRPPIVAKYGAELDRLYERGS
jgi:long-chain acyl-CoA synthetase